MSVTMNARSALRALEVGRTLVELNYHGVPPGYTWSRLLCPVIWEAVVTDDIEPFFQALIHESNRHTNIPLLILIDFLDEIRTLHAAFQREHVDSPSTFNLFLCSRHLSSSFHREFSEDDYLSAAIQEGVLEFAGIWDSLSQALTLMFQRASQDRSRARSALPRRIHASDERRARSAGPRVNRHQQQEIQAQAVARAKAAARTRGTSPTPEADRCQICQCRLVGSTESWPFCGHTFHTECLTQLRQRPGQLTCPRCGVAEDGIPRASGCPHGLYEVCDQGCGRRCVPHNLWSGLTGCSDCFPVGNATVPEASINMDIQTTEQTNKVNKLE